jgi:hypothetical protein
VRCAVVARSMAPSMSDGLEGMCWPRTRPSAGHSQLIIWPEFRADKLEGNREIPVAILLADVKVSVLAESSRPFR